MRASAKLREGATVVVIETEPGGPIELRIGARRFTMTRSKAMSLLEESVDSISDQQIIARVLRDALARNGGRRRRGANECHL